MLSLLATAVSATELYTLVKPGMSIFRHFRIRFQEGDRICIYASVNASHKFANGLIIGLVPVNRINEWPNGFIDNAYCGANPEKRFSDVQDIINWSKLEISTENYLQYTFCTFGKYSEVQSPFVYVCHPEDDYFEVSLAYSPEMSNYLKLDDDEVLTTIILYISLILMAIPAIVWILMWIRKFDSHILLHVMITISLVVSIAARVVDIVIHCDDSNANLLDAVFCGLRTTEGALIMSTLLLLCKGWYVTSTSGLIEKGSLSCDISLAWVCGVVMNLSTIAVRSDQLDASIVLIISIMVCLLYCRRCIDIGLDTLDQILDKLTGMRNGPIDPKGSALDIQVKLIKKLMISNCIYLVIYNIGMIFELGASPIIARVLHTLCNLWIYIKLITSFYPSDTNVNLYVKEGRKLDNELIMSPDVLHELADALVFSDSDDVEDL